MLLQGRNEALIDYIRCLPDEGTHTNAWLRYWFGIALAPNHWIGNQGVVGLPAFLGAERAAMRVFVQVLVVYNPFFLTDAYHVEIGKAVRSRYAELIELSALRASPLTVATMR
jgi:hypothetical protein